MDTDRTDRGTGDNMNTEHDTTTHDTDTRQTPRARRMTRAQLLEILEIVAAQHGMDIDAFVSWQTDFPWGTE